jgi:hypothetical protein
VINLAKKRIDILIVEDFTQGSSLNSAPPEQIIETETSKIIISRVHLPVWLEEQYEERVTGVHVVVSEIVEA